MSLEINNNSTNGEEYQESLVEQPDDINREKPQEDSSNIPISHQITSDSIPSPPVTRSGRQVRWSRRYQEGLESSLAETGEDDEYYDALHREDYKIQDDMNDPISFAASSDPDTLYYHEAMKATDAKEFIKAMSKEFNDHCERGHGELIPIEEVPTGEKILDAVWSMKRKEDIKTQKIIKHKARLNVHGGQQQYGINYFETYPQW